MVENTCLIFLEIQELVEVVWLPPGWARIDPFGPQQCHIRLSQGLKQLLLICNHCFLGIKRWLLARLDQIRTSPGQAVAILGPTWPNTTKPGYYNPTRLKPTIFHEARGPQRAQKFYLRGPSSQGWAVTISSYPQNSFLTRDLVINTFNDQDAKQILVLGSYIVFYPQG